MSNSLYNYFLHNKKGLIHKWHHYFPIYEAHFRRFRRKKITLLEIGVSHGGSLQMWKKYFGRNATIVGVDINPECKRLEENKIYIRIGSQEDSTFLKKLAKEFGPFDIIIDDGGHTVKQQNITFDSLYSSVKPNGVYLVEDLHTNYWHEFGGGYMKRGTFVERSKHMVDKLYAWHSKDKRLLVDTFTRTTDSIHFYDSIIVFEKRTVSEPEHQQIGNPTLSRLESWDYRKRRQ